MPPRSVNRAMMTLRRVNRAMMTFLIVSLAMMTLRIENRSMMTLSALKTRPNLIHLLLPYTLSRLKKNMTTIGPHGTITVDS